MYRKKYMDTFSAADKRKPPEISHFAEKCKSKNQYIWSRRRKMTVSSTLELTTMTLHGPHTNMKEWKRTCRPNFQSTIPTSSYKSWFRWHCIDTVDRSFMTPININWLSSILIDIPLPQKRSLIMRSTNEQD